MARGEPAPLEQGGCTRSVGLGAGLRTLVSDRLPGAIAVLVLIVDAASALPRIASLHDPASK